MSTTGKHFENHLNGFDDIVNVNNEKYKYKVVMNSSVENCEKQNEERQIGEGLYLSTCEAGSGRSVVSACTLRYRIL